jgi:hypothetical protein
LHLFVYPLLIFLLKPYIILSKNNNSYMALIYSLYNYLFPIVNPSP